MHAKLIAYANPEYLSLCDQCVAATINGTLAHEHGCPNANKED